MYNRYFCEGKESGRKVMDRERRGEYGREGEGGRDEHTAG